MNSIQNYGYVNFQARNRFLVPVKKAVEVPLGETEILTEEKLTAKIQKLRRRIKYVKNEIQEYEVRMQDTYQKGLEPFIDPKYNELCDKVISFKDKIKDLISKRRGLDKTI